MVEPPVCTGKASGSILDIPIFFTKEKMKKHDRAGDVAQSITDERSLLCRGCSSVVERPFRIGKASGSILDIPIFFTKEKMKKHDRAGDVAQSITDERSLLCRGCSSVVERPFRIGKASGSFPDISNFFHKRGDEKARS